MMDFRGMTLLKNTSTVQTSHERINYKFPRIKDNFIHVCNNTNNP